mmetsp:Transcript_4542/g.18694  ORF Transcript_4542/g.18694 Transcript_4542/m.18694 type:complete len:208 (-) Transcript_4542:158-781(-)
MPEPRRRGEFLPQFRLLPRAPARAVPDAEAVHRPAQEQRAALVRRRRRGRGQPRDEFAIPGETRFGVVQVLAVPGSPRRAVLPPARPARPDAAPSASAAPSRREDAHDPVEPRQRGSHVRWGARPRADRLLPQLLVLHVAVRAEARLVERGAGTRAGPLRAPAQHERQTALPAGSLARHVRGVVVGAVVVGGVRARHGLVQSVPPSR